MGELLYQFNYKESGWKFCDEAGYESRMGNWDFELRKLQVLGDDISAIEPAPQEQK